MAKFSRLSHSGSDFQLFKCSNVQIVKLSNAQMFKYSNVHILSVKYQMSNINKAKLLPERTSGFATVIFVFVNHSLTALLVKTVNGV